MKKRDVPGKLKDEILNYLAESLSFIKTIQEFPTVTIEDIQEILRHAAKSGRGNPESDISLGISDFVLYTDGACRGNPGEAGAGAVIQDREGNVINEKKAYLGISTNNVAEYMGMVLGLKEVLKLGGTVVHIFSDSELMVKQLEGHYSVKSKSLMVLYSEVKELLKKFVGYDINHIDRGKNHYADRLANEAIDEKIQDSDLISVPN